MIRSRQQWNAPSLGKSNPTRLSRQGFREFQPIRHGMGDSMTGTATFNEVTLKEIEWRSHAVIAGTAQTIVRVVKQSRVGQSARREILHGQILLNVRSISGLMRDLLNLFHAGDAIVTLEGVTPEQREHIVETLRDVHVNVEDTIARLHPTRYWKKLYRSSVAKLKAYNAELEAHASAFCATDSQLILLTKNDQDQLLDALSRPAKPNAALRRAFARK
jgi:uncharacterized protein DUF1778